MPQHTVIQQVTKMAELIIKDNTLNDKTEFADISHLAGKITDKTLEQLEKEGVFVFPELKEAEDITKDQVILQSVNECYRSGNVMGFLGYGQERLIIGSRFSPKQKDNDFFLQYLVDRVLSLPNLLELYSVANQDSLEFDLLWFVFPYYLKKAMRKGLYKTYIQKQYNDGNIKGAIDIARHIRKNTPFIGNISYNQREFSYDNYLMQLIRHTLEFIKKKPVGNKLLQRIKDEVALVVDTTKNYEFFDRRKVIAENIKKPLRHAYYGEYRALQRLCIMILQHQKHQIGSGALQIHGILFDGAWLWEEYINLLIGCDFYHPMNKSHTDGQMLFTSGAYKTGPIYPDFISRDADNRIIADAKYKPADNIRSSDYEQLLAYMFRFDSKKGYYLYPKSDIVDNIELKLNRGSTYEKNVCARDDIKIIKCGLTIPNNANDYEDFKNKIKKSEEAFIARVLS